MTDYEINVETGELRWAGDGRKGARNPFTWLKHPRDRGCYRPEQPRFALSGDRWSAERATFTTLLDAGRLKDALDSVIAGGFCLTIEDVPEAHRAQLIGFVRRTYKESRDWMAGGGWLKVRPKPKWEEEAVA